MARLRCYKWQELKAEQEAADPFWMKAGVRVREVHTSISQRLELHLLLLFSSFSCSSLDSHRWAPRNQGEMGNGCLILPLEPRRGLCVSPQSQIFICPLTPGWMGFGTTWSGESEQVERSREGSHGCTVLGYLGSLGRPMWVWQCP